MKSFSIGTRFVITFLSFAFLLLASAIIGNAQDTVKVTGAFQNLNVASNNLPGVNGSVEYKVGGFGDSRLGIVVDGAYQRDTLRVLDRYQALAGPQFSYGFFEGKLTVFARPLFGATYFDQRKGGRDFTRMTVSFGGGFDVKLTDRFFWRPLQVDAQYIDQRPVRYTRFGTGGGFRF